MLEARGAFLRHPERKRRARTDLADLGGPPERLDAKHRAVWNEVLDSLPPGVAKSAHAFAFERMVRLILKDRNGTISNSEGSQMIVLFSRFGMTPSDLEKIGEKEGYTIILERRTLGLLYFNNAIDITDRVTDAYDKQNP